MKIYNILFAIVFMTGLTLSGCTTAPQPSPRKGPSPIYDEDGRPIWVPPPDHWPVQRPVNTDVEETAGAQEDMPSRPSAEYTEPPASTKPAPRIGVDEDAEPVPEDSHLLAAVTPLADQAEQQMKMGQLDRAFATAERAVRIDPDNSKLWNLLARIQFKQENYSQAEQLARKSNLLAHGDYEIQALNWKIIAAVLSQRGEEESARQALKKSHEFEQ